MHPSVDRSTARILFVVSEVGYTWDEVILPYLEATAAGYAIGVTTPRGEVPEVDPVSVHVRSVLNHLGLGTAATVAPDTDAGRALRRILDRPQPIGRVEANEWDAIYVAGGHGALFDLNRNGELHDLVREMYDAGKPVALACHAVSTLAFMSRDGRPLLEGRRVTGFPTLWEHVVLRLGWVHPRFLPLPIWTGRELDRTATGRTWWTRLRELVDLDYVVVDGRLVTGVGPKSGAALTRELLRLL